MQKLQSNIAKLPDLLNPDRVRTLQRKERNFFGKLVKEEKFPQEYRRELWLRATGAKALIAQNPDYYKRLLESFNDYPNPHFNQIELDLKRTFPEDKFYNNKETLGSLRNILTAFSKRNMSVGYC